MTLADDRYSEILRQIGDGPTPTRLQILAEALDTVVGERLSEAHQQVPDRVADDQGWIVVCLNRYGVAVSFGPYGEREAHYVADFVVKLTPTWMLDLDTLSLERYGMDSTGSTIEEPEHLVAHLHEPAEDGSVDADVEPF